MSMPSDLAATSPLLLQLLIPQGFTLQSRPAQTQSQTQAPGSSGDPLLSLVSPQGPGLWTSYVPILQSQAPGTTTPPPHPHTSPFFFFFLITTNSRVKSQTVALLSGSVSWVLSQCERCQHAGPMHM